MLKILYNSNSSRVRFFRASPVMGAHQAVLLTSSKSVHLRRRVLSLRIAPVSPLFSALAKSAQPSHSTQLSFPLFSCTYELFCTGEKATPFPLCASALFAKNTQGGGGPCLTIISLSEPRAALIFPIPPLCPLCSRWHPCCFPSFLLTSIEDPDSVGTVNCQPTQD